MTRPIVITLSILGISLSLSGHNTLNIPISEGGTNSSHMHTLAKFQRYRGLELLLSDTRFMTMVNSFSFTMDFKKINVCHMLVSEECQVPRRAMLPRSFGSTRFQWKGIQHHRFTVTNFPRSLIGIFSVVLFCNYDSVISIPSKPMLVGFHSKS